MAVDLISDDILGSANSDDVFFGFLESSDNFSDPIDYVDIDEADEIIHTCDVEDNKLFWEKQEQLLQATMCRTSSVESKIRQATKEALREAKLFGVQCTCRKPAGDDCLDCLRTVIAVRLQNAGFDCAICKSKWRKSLEMPAGEHSYLEVVDSSNLKNGTIRVIIELNFRVEFEIGKASEEYKRLVGRLPELYVGKSERLKSLVKILCAAGKRCMKERNIYMGPWRKHKYMQAKWLGTREKMSMDAKLPARYSGGSQGKPRVSMLTNDLLDCLPEIFCPAVAVL